MADPWYVAVSPDDLLTQGELVFDCPLVRWKSVAPSADCEALKGILRDAQEAFMADVVVMTQDCDLEQNKVNNVVVCAHFSLDRFRDFWERDQQALNQNPTPRSWKGLLDAIHKGELINLRLINEGVTGGTTMQHRIVDFREVFTLPRSFLESFVRHCPAPRVRLGIPYRESLSQDFAEVFGRIGHPVPIATSWRDEKR